MIKRIIKSFSVIGSLIILGGFIVLALFVLISFDLPQISSLSDYKPPIPSKIYSSDGELLLEAGNQKREIIEFEKIPKLVVNSFLAAEDDKFYEHHGINYMGLARAMMRNILAGGYVQGGSTITQQVAKSLLLSGEKTITRKIKDFLLAQKIEEKFSKEEILFLYLNQVYLGGGYYGIKEAARGYFEKNLDEVTIAESALVAGLLVAPGRYSPYISPKKAKMRQLYVLGRLHTTGKISLEEYEKAKREPIKMRYKRGSSFKGGHFTDWVRQQFVEKLGESEFLTGGYEIQTTLNWQLQNKAEKEVLSGVKEADKRQGFKGPIKNIPDEQVQEYVFEQRKKHLTDKSNFFIFDVDGTNTNEFHFDEEDFKKRIANKKLELEEVNANNRHQFSYGVIEIVNEPYILNLNESVEAIVREVNDKQQMVYLNYAGTSIVIPYDWYKWAHPRLITEEHQYFPFIKKPSEILKVGDVVLVTIKEMPKIIKGHMNRDFQQVIEKDKKLNEYFSKQKYYVAELDQYPEVEGALLSIDPHNGNIISLVGGSNFDKSQFNRVIQSNRQPGSSFKPFIFAAAIENGFNPASILLDSPAALGGANDSLDWKPRNYDGDFKGEMTLRKSLEVSRNIPTIKLVQEVGVDKLINFAKRLGINAQLPNDLSIALGSFGISLASLVEAYSIFPNYGKKVRIKSIIGIKDRYGKPFFFEEKVVPEVPVEEVKVEKNTSPEAVATTNEPKKEVEEVKVNEFLTGLGGKQVYDRRLSYIMTNLLKGVIQNGTGRAAREVSPYIAGKTGTTNSYVDSLFLGYSKNIVTGVWFGFDDNKTLGFGETGSKNALPIWSEFMKLALKIYGDEDFETPNGIVNVYINRETGALSSSNKPNSILESFAAGTEPGIEKEIINPPLKTDEPTQILDDDEYYSDQ